MTRWFCDHEHEGIPCRAEAVADTRPICPRNMHHGHMRALVPAEAKADDLPRGLRAIDALITERVAVEMVD